MNCNAEGPEETPTTAIMSSIVREDINLSKGRNDFTHHQLKDYDVFSVKKLEIRPTEKSASKIPKVRGGGVRGFWKKLIFKPHILYGSLPLV